MANIKVSEMPTATSINNEDYLMVVQGNENKKITAETLSLKPNIITGQLAENYTLTSNDYEKITLSSIATIGDNLSISNGGIKCAKSGFVKVSAKIVFNSCSAGEKWLTLLRDTAAAAAMPFNTSTNRISLSIPPLLINVQANQTFYMQVRGASGDVIRGARSYTEMTVEYV